MENAYSGFSRICAVFLIFCGFSCLGGDLWTPHVDDRGINHILDMRGVEILDHLDACPAVLRDLIDIVLEVLLALDLDRLAGLASLEFATKLQVPIFGNVFQSRPLRFFPGIGA